jgi:Flp pilus assembly protein TadD
MSQGETDAAIEEFRKAIALGTTSKEVHLNLAAALQRKGLHDEAMLEYARAFERTP